MIKREFIVTRTELQLHTGKVEVTAVEPEQVTKPHTEYESMFLYLDPKKDTVPMVGETLTVEIKVGNV